VRVEIDISRLHPQSLKRGVGFYTLNLFQALKKFKSKDRFFLKKKERDLQTDLVHYPFFDPFFTTLPLIKNKPVVVTIHDLIPLKFPKHYPPGVKGKLSWQIQKLSLKGVDLIITDSLNSKKDINEITGLPLKKIKAVYLAVDKRFKKISCQKKLAKTKKKYRLPDKFILYVGDLNWNKNVLGLAKACLELKIPLVLVGQQAASRNFDPSHPENQPLVLIQELIKKNKNLIRPVGFLSLDQLVNFYNLADLYVQPSFYEGFGLPLLEALSCGCPVICSDQASLPEIGGQAVVYFDPYQENDLLKKIKKLFSKQKKLRILKKKGLKQSKKFSWEKTAWQTRRVYEKVLAEK